MNKLKYFTKASVILIGLTAISCTMNTSVENNSKIKYPETKKVDTVDVYFGHKVADPYRWLEDDNSEETKKWVEAENKVTGEYLSKIPFRKDIEERLRQLLNYPKQSQPFEKAGKYFFYQNNGLQNQSVLMVKDSLNGEARILLDPNTLSEDGTVSLAGIDISKDGKYLIYSIAKSGSDWNEIFVKNIETGENLPDHIEWVKFSELSWYDNGFFYSGYDAPKENKALTQANKFHKLYYHKLGTSQTEDKVIMQNEKDETLMFTGHVTDNQKYLIVSEEKLGTRGNKILIKNLKNNSNFYSINDNYTNRLYVAENIDDNFYVVTNEDAPKNKLILLKEGQKTSNGKEIIPESDNVIDGVSFAGDKLFVKYMKDAHSLISAYNYEGKYLYDIQLPTIGTASLPSGKPGKNLAFYTFTSFTYPSVIYKYDVKNNKSEIYYKSKIDFDIENYETKQVFYTSKDGTKIPMFIVHKKGLKLDGNNPTLLYGYGGFNISLTPSFSVTRLILLENGGVFAMANLRGGGEYGEEWHQAGTKLNKQNVFDDFIYAAKYLIDNKYTNPEKLAIQGGSNGGLLVGAVTNQRPDLFKVALPAVGVMDMLRYHKFTIGYAWVSDYGSSEESEESFLNLLSYSPLHNISDTTEYPAIMVMTADHDDRVVPAHSFKYAATLQEKYKGENPVLIRIEHKAGHGAGKPIEKIIEEYADIYAFMFYNLGVTPKYNKKN